jgi:hypothetical protein
MTRIRNTQEGPVNGRPVGRSAGRATPQHRQVRTRLAARSHHRARPFPFSGAKGIPPQPRRRAGRMLAAPRRASPAGSEGMGKGYASASAGCMLCPLPAAPIGGIASARRGARKPIMQGAYLNHRHRHRGSRTARDSRQSARCRANAACNRRGGPCRAPGSRAPAARARQPSSRSPRRLHRESSR